MRNNYHLLMLNLSKHEGELARICEQRVLI